MSSCTISIARAGIGHVRDDEGELVAAEAGHGGAARDGAQQALGDFAQEPVTDGVTERVVHVLEAVDVEQHDGDPAALAQGGGGAGQEEHPVGQTGQHVVGRLVRLGVDLVAQLLDQPGALEAGAGVGDQRLEEAEVVLVEAVQLLVAVEGDDGTDRRVPVHQGCHDGVVVLAGDRVDGERAPGRGVLWSDASPVAMACVTMESSSSVIGSMPEAPRS